MPADIRKLIEDAQSSIDSVRKTAETNLLKWCDEDATQVFISLVHVALGDNSIISFRQFALVALRKLITMFWSPGFESYRGAVPINQDAKTFVRDSLLHLSLQDASLSKLRNAASYCVVQICAVDFPDEWPNILQVIYEAILSNCSLPAMSLLNEIYDDVVSEEMFFEDNIGPGTIDIIFRILKDPKSNCETILVALNLFHACLLELLTVSSSSSSKRKHIVMNSINEVFKIWGRFLQLNANIENLDYMKIRSKIYEDLALLKNEFPTKLFPKDNYLPFKDLVLHDLEDCAKVYLSIANRTDESAQLETVNEFAVRALEFLTSICDFTFEANEMSRIIVVLESLCCYSDETMENWSDDFNSFVSAEAGLTASFTTRDQAAEFLTALNDASFLMAFKCILKELSTISENDNSWKSQESILYLLQSIISNETQPSDDLGNIVLNVPLFLSSLLDWREANEFVQSRTMNLIPKFLEKFMDVFKNVKVLTADFFMKSLDLSLSSTSEIMKSSLLVGFTYYAYFADLPSVLGSEVCQEMQIKMLKLIYQVSQGAEDDTDGLLMEILSLLIDCNINGSHDNEILQSEFHLVLTISAKEPSNIQVVVESQTCLRKLLRLDGEAYAAYAERCLPSFLKVIEANKQTGYNYTPLLSLTLQLLDVFMSKKPTDSTISSSVLSYVFEPLKDVLLSSNDDDILQITTSSFNHLLYNSSSSEICPHLEETILVLDRLLSFDVSDTAAQNSGTLIVTILARFPAEIQSMFPVIINAVTEKLLKVKSIITSQNLVSVFCYLTCVDAYQTVDFLAGIQVENGNTTALALIISKWLEIFEEIRNETKVKENVFALSKLFLLADPRLAALKVNGNIIPYQGDQIITRSRAKEMPDRYTQVPFYTKIVMLFLTELDAQGRQQSEELFSNIPSRNDDAAEGGVDEDWEDVEDVLEYEKLQEYVQDSDEENGYDGYEDDDAYKEISQIYNLTQSTEELLVEFFREVTSKNINDFQSIYNSLSEEEKKVLSDNLV
ncbi:hypothetical protein HG535_0G04970 [Zygotorulaspora mrakii]|uniref:Importin N-terminal domain-containing protein n=1 Tax=Zygotorulaspora mrakii TaxID=42260 RepID=A0A7H9B8P0_ZYGMR|nr:uncharacterized protein HG535_0G04970 [Zygotorulaspora mrakii]QLG74614.1 hypothetical protein HG535_0G04970 [Zygotorulaspora mrakii]